MHSHRPFQPIKAFVAAIVELLRDDADLRPYFEGKDPPTTSADDLVRQLRQRQVVAEGPAVDAVIDAIARLNKEVMATAQAAAPAVTPPGASQAGAAPAPPDHHLPRLGHRCVAA